MGAKEHLPDILGGRLAPRGLAHTAQCGIGKFDPAAQRKPQHDLAVQWGLIAASHLGSVSQRLLLEPEEQARRAIRGRAVRHYYASAARAWRRRRAAFATVVTRGLSKPRHIVAAPIVAVVRALVAIAAVAQVELGHH